MGYRIVESAVVLAAALTSCRESGSCPTCPPVAEAKPAQPGVPSVGSASTAAATATAFTRTYDDAIWGKNESGTGHSGTGSTLHATVVYRAFLQQFLKDHNIKTVVDAGCGDWEFSQTIDWSGIDYRGYDIVESVIAKDKTKFGAPNINFFVGNIVEDELPAADLLISKHVMQHLPNADVIKFLGKRGKYKHVLLVNGVDPVTLLGTNTDIAVGDYRTLDVTQPPFDLRAAKLLSWWDGHHMNQVTHLTP